MNGELFLLNKTQKFGRLPKILPNMTKQHPKGKPFSDGEKQCCLNVFQYVSDNTEGIKRSAAVYHTSKITGISTKSVYSFLHEKLAKGKVETNKILKPNSKNMYEKLSHNQLKLIREAFHNLCRKCSLKSNLTKNDKKDKIKFPTMKVSVVNWCLYVFVVLL